MLHEVWETTGIKPKALESEPELSNILGAYYKAFLFMFDRKNQGEKITFSDIIDYRLLFGGVEDTELLLMVITVAEKVFIKKNQVQP